MLNTVHELLESLFVFPVNTEETVFVWTCDGGETRLQAISSADAARVLMLKGMVEDETTGTRSIFDSH